jgi:hypothetical protein
VIAAGAAGVAIGLLISELTGLDAWAEDAFAWLLGGRKRSDTERREDFAGQEEYADGTVIESKTRKVLRIGTGPISAAPKEVRDARQSGAQTADEINAFNDKRRSGAPAAPFAYADASPLIEATKEGSRASRAVERAVQDMRRDARRNRIPGPWAPTPVGE